MNNLLIEKYRPKDLSDVAGNTDTLTTLKLIQQHANLPHLLFTGPPGTGKTTCAKIIAKKLSTEVLELNASDDRGLDVVRDQIKIFAQKRSKGLKIAILDEADSMTTAAQQALRRLMETANDTRFILICNTFSKIFEPIQSRCAVLKFDKLSNQMLKERLMEIVNKEMTVKLDENIIETILKLSDGDMRQALNLLQSIFRLDMVDENTLLTIAGQPSPALIEDILKELMNKNLNDAIKKFELVWAHKFDPQDIISSFFRAAKTMESYEVLKCVGLVQTRIIEGVNSKLQFYALFYDIIKSTAK